MREGYLKQKTSVIKAVGINLISQSSTSLFSQSSVPEKFSKLLNTNYYSKPGESQTQHELNIMQTLKIIFCER